MRSFLCLLVMVSSLVACESDAPPVTTGDRSPTTSAPSQPVVLSHSFEAGQILHYELDVRRELTMSTDGSPEAPLDELPVSASVAATAMGVVELDVTESTEDGTSLEVTWAPAEISREGAVDDAPLEEGEEVEGLGALTALPATIEVDGTGAVSVPGPEAIISALPPLPGFRTGFLGPVLPVEAVRVGEDWSRTVVRADGTEAEVAGRLPSDPPGEAVTIEGATSVPARDTDLSAFYGEFLASFQDSETAPRLVVRRGAYEEEWNARFDTRQGRIVEGTASARGEVRTEGAAPDRATGQEAPFEIRVATTDTLRVRLVEGPET